MCGRFALATTPEKIKAQFGVDSLPDMVPAYNIAPTQPVLCITQAPDGEKRVESFVWGLVPFFAKTPKVVPPLINARAETVLTKPAFRESFKQKRCIVLMSGFFEWITLDDKKYPYYIRPKIDTLLAVAGLWDVWHAQEQVVHSCCVITTPPNALLEPFHNRMPAILAGDDINTWLKHTNDTTEILACLKPYTAADLIGYAVTPKMNTWTFTNKEAIQPLA